MRTLYDEATGQQDTADPQPGGGQQGDPQPGGQQQTPQLPKGAAWADGRFREVLPEDLRAHPSLAKVSDLEGMARSLVHAQGMIGRDPDRLVELPDADDRDGRVAVLRKLGAPEKPEGYEFKVPEGTPDPLRIDAEDGIGGKFATWAHEERLLPEQAQGLYERFVGEMKSISEAQEAQAEARAEENVRKLQSEFGQAFDAKIAAANFGIDKLGGEDLRKKLNAADLGTDPDVMRAFARAGEMLAEDEGGDVGGRGAFGGGTTPDEARAKGNELLRQAMNETNPAEQRRLNAKAQEWFAMAVPKKAG